ncbi:hypothetical protein B4U80_14360 [Leptotrombidium deliense]|uniref:C-type lectin domain-containing protein n=1 Tax=Leptotrombidium deliense TaxID=299467 RepID=A0A443RWW5_9ACAR|nr:hypothetical protein B4U80_14360 [Leptotrombidium deliense]
MTRRIYIIGFVIFANVLLCKAYNNDVMVVRFYDGCIYSDGYYRNYAQMKSFCESIDGSLVTIHSFLENLHFVNTFPAYATFLGLKRYASTWYWVDGYWEDHNCNSYLPTACKLDSCGAYFDKMERKEEDRIKDFINSAEQKIYQRHSEAVNNLRIELKSLLLEKLNATTPKPIK